MRRSPSAARPRRFGPCAGATRTSVVVAVVLALAVVVVLALVLSEDEGGGPVGPAVTGTQAPAPSKPLDLGPAPDRPQEPTPEPAVLTGTVIGRVVRSDYRPVKEANIAALEGSALVLGFVLRDLPSLGRRAVTANDGRFELTEVPATDRLILRLSGTGFAITDAGPFTLRVGELLDLGDIVVEPGLVIKGVVNSPRGAPVEGARVGLHFDPFISDWGIRNPKPSMVVLTDSEGLFAFTGARGGLFTLTIDTEDYAAGLHRGELGGEHGNEVWVPITLLEPITVTGIVVGSPGAVPLAGARVIAQPLQEVAGVGKDEAITDADGNYVLKHMQLGTYGISGEFPGHRNFGSLVTIKGDTRVPLRLPRNGMLSGTVITRNGEPCRHFDLQVFRLSRPVSLGVKVGDFHRFRTSDGSFTVEDLVEGFYEVEVWAKDHALARTDAVYLDQGEHLQGLQVHLERGAVLTGIVQDTTGTPVAGAIVTMNLNEQSQIDFIKASIERRSDLRSTESGDDGRFEIKGLSGDTYQIEVNHPQYAMLVRNDIVVSKGADVEIDAPIVLQRAGSIRGVAFDNSGTARSNVRVRLNAEWGYSTEVRTNGRGEFTFARLPPGRYTMYAISVKPDITFAELMGQALSETHAPAKEWIVLEQGEELYRNVKLTF